MTRVVALLLLYLFSDIYADNFTFTYQMAHKCKQHVCKMGYNYDHYYRIGEQRHMDQSPGIDLEMHIAIMASSNGHVVLSPEAFPGSKTPVYEFVIGGGSNKFTELRRNLRTNAKASASTLGILSSTEFRAFYIRISDGGFIEFGKEGETMPIMTYNDPDPIKVRYFSFASWHPIESIVLYDCPAPGSDEIPDSQEVLEPNMSNSDKLKRQLLLDRKPEVPPGPAIDIRLGFRITRVTYNVFDSRLTTNIAMVVSWTDENMSWSPEKFDNVTRLSFRQGQVWRPSFFVYNAHDIGAIISKTNDLIHMDYNGVATLHLKAKTNTFCYDYSTSYNKWPRDAYNCTIILGAWEAHEKINIELMKPGEDKLKVYSYIDEDITDEWEIKAGKRVYSPESWQLKFNYEDNDTLLSDKLVIKFNLTRRASSYNIMFYTPLLVLIMFKLMSFWTEPLRMARVHFYCGATVVICMGFSYIDILVPCNNIPSILVLYVTVMLGMIVALLVQVCLMTSLAKKLCKTTLMQNIMTNKWLRLIFCLPAMKTCKNYDTINEAYTTQDDDDSGVISPRNGAIEEMETDVTAYGETAELAEVLDKILFVVFSVTYAVMLACHF